MIQTRKTVMTDFEPMSTDSEKYDLDRLSSLSAETRPVMLFIDDEVPQYDVSAGNFIINEYLKIFLNNGFRIIYWPYNRLKIEPYTHQMQESGIEVVYGDVSFPDFMEKAGAYINVAFVCRPEIAAGYLDSILTASRCKIIYFSHDLHFLRLSREAELTGSQETSATALAMKKKELGVMRKADISLFLNAKEAAMVRSEEAGIKTAVIPWIQPVNPGKRTAFAERRDIVYLGNFIHQPNVDAAIWFHDQVFPIIREADPGIRARIIGSRIPPGIAAMDNHNFQIVGYVEDLDEPLGQARVFVCPIRYGAGIKGKIAMAESYGLPVVTTGIGAEGMNLADGETALIADDAAGFAKKVLTLYSDQKLWEKVSANSVRHVADNFSPETAEAVIMDIIANLENAKDVRWQRILSLEDENRRQDQLIVQQNFRIRLLEHNLHETNREMDRVRSTFSWKITLPFRAVRVLAIKFLALVKERRHG